MNLISLLKGELTDVSNIRSRRLYEAKMESALAGYVNTPNVKEVIPLVIVDNEVKMGTRKG